MYQQVAPQLGVGWISSAPTSIQVQSEYQTQNLFPSGGLSR
jgi:hypothetical protein